MYYIYIYIYAYVYIIIYIYVCGYCRSHEYQLISHGFLLINAPANWKMYGKANSGANLSNLGNSPGILGIFGTSHFWTNPYFELLIGCVCVYTHIYIYVCMLCISVYTVYIHIYIYIHISRYPRKQITFMLVETPVISYFYSLSDRKCRRWGCGFGASAGEIWWAPIRKWHGTRW